MPSHSSLDSSAVRIFAQNGKRYRLGVLGSHIFMSQFNPVLSAPFLRTLRAAHSKPNLTSSCSCLCLMSSPRAVGKRPCDPKIYESRCLVRSTERDIEMLSQTLFPTTSDLSPTRVIMTISTVFGLQQGEMSLHPLLSVCG
jgi:hypothetical protein